jgi:phosphatidylinositol-3-phosphatase
MRRLKALAMCLVSAAGTSAGCGAPPAAHQLVSPSTKQHAAVPAPPAIPRYDHVFVIVDENTSFDAVIGSPQASYLTQLADSYGLAADYHGVAHPSDPNYLALTAGSTLGLHGDCLPMSCSFTAPNITDRIEAAGLSWKAYFESMPFACDAGSDDRTRYDAGLNVFLFYRKIQSRPDLCRRHDVPMSQLPVDLSATDTVSSYVWIAPNICHDMHTCGVAVGDQWLAGVVPQILASPAWRLQRSVLFITWDEDHFTPVNHVATLVIARDVKPGFRSDRPYDHYSLLRTMEEALGLQPLTANDATASVLSDFFG